VLLQPELRVPATREGCELSVRASFDYRATVQKEDLIRIHNRGESMSDDHRGPVEGGAFQRFQDLLQNVKMESEKEKHDGFDFRVCWKDPDILSILFVNG